MFAYVIRVYVPFILLLRNMQKYNILELNEKLLPELQSIAEELGIKKVSSLKKEELVYRILDEQAISYAGIQAEKMKEKEAKKPVEGRKRGRPAKAASPKVAKAETAEAAESAQQASEKPVAAPADKKEQKEQPERKKRVRIEKKEKVAGAIAPSEDNKEVVVSKEPQTISMVTEISAVETPAVVESPVEKPLLPPVVAELETEEEAALPENTTPVEVAEETTSPQATEEEPKRIVFRHPDAKSVLDQIFPFSAPKPGQTAQQAAFQLRNPRLTNLNPRPLPSRIILDRTIDRIIIITTVITITLITTSRLKRKCMSLTASLQEPACWR